MFVVKLLSYSWCCLQTEGEAHQQAVPALCGSRPGDALLCGEGEAEWSGLLLLLRGAALHHPHGGSHRPLVSSHLPGVRCTIHCVLYYRGHLSELLIYLIFSFLVLSGTTWSCPGWSQTTSPLQWAKSCCSSWPSARWPPSFLE